MKSDRRYLNLYFQVHQPRRRGKFQFFDIGAGRGHFDDELNRDIVCGEERFVCLGMDYETLACEKKVVNWMFMRLDL
jgi:hypothetical protein